MPGRAKASTGTPIAVSLGWGLLALWILAPETLHAQATIRGRVAVCAGNALPAVLSSVATAILKDQPVAPAIASGLVGGTAICGAKLLASTGTTCAGIVGRQMTAFAHGIVLSHGNWDEVLDHTWLPLGPIAFSISAPSRIRLDLSTAVVFVYGVARSDLRLDYRATLAAGAIVFRHPGTLQLNGEAVDGLEAHSIIFMSRVEPRRVDRVLANETIHVLQSDFLKVAVAYPLERAVRNRFGFGSSHIEIGATGVGVQELGDWLAGGLGPITGLRELEARVLTQ